MDVGAPLSTTNTTAMVIWGWDSPLPYLFGGLAGILCLVSLSLLVLDFSYRNSSYNRSPLDVEKPPKPVPLPTEYEHKIVVIMAGNTEPIGLALVRAVTTHRVHIGPPTKPVDIIPLSHHWASTGIIRGAGFSQKASIIVGAIRGLMNPLRDFSVSNMGLSFGPTAPNNLHLGPKPAQACPNEPWALIPIIGLALVRAVTTYRVHIGPPTKPVDIVPLSYHWASTSLIRGAGFSQKASTIVGAIRGLMNPLRDFSISNVGLSFGPTTPNRAYILSHACFFNSKYAARSLRMGSECWYKCSHYRKA